MRALGLLLAGLLINSRLRSRSSQPSREEIYFREANAIHDTFIRSLYGHNKVQALQRIDAIQSGDMAVRTAFAALQALYTDIILAKKRVGRLSALETLYNHCDAALKQFNAAVQKFISTENNPFRQQQRRYIAQRLTKNDFLSSDGNLTPIFKSLLAGNAPQTIHAHLSRPQPSPILRGLLFGALAALLFGCATAPFVVVGALPLVAGLIISAVAVVFLGVLNYFEQRAKNINSALIKNQVIMADRSVEEGASNSALQQSSPFNPKAADAPHPDNGKGSQHHAALPRPAGQLYARQSAADADPTSVIPATAPPASPRFPSLCQAAVT